MDKMDYDWSATSIAVAFIQEGIKDPVEIANLTARTMQELCIKIGEKKKAMLLEKKERQKLQQMEVEKIKVIVDSMDDYKKIGEEIAAKKLEVDVMRDKMHGIKLNKKTTPHFRAKRGEYQEALGVLIKQYGNLKDKKKKYWAEQYERLIRACGMFDELECEEMFNPTEKVKEEEA